jgi:hypothetical protein
MEMLGYVGAIVGVLGGLTGSLVGILGARTSRTGDASQLLAVLRVATVVSLLLALVGAAVRFAVPAEPVYLSGEILWFAGASGLSVMTLLSASRSGASRTHTRYLTVVMASGVLLTALGLQNLSAGGDWGRSVRELIWGTILLSNYLIFLFVVKRSFGRARAK